MEYNAQGMPPKRDNKLFNFVLNNTDGKARTGTLVTPHGYVNTPVFMPVGTQATVKALTPAQLEEVGANLVLANTYHLHLRPGEDIIANLGGLHSFMHWKKPILTDSGGFQVFSLGDLRQVDDEGVTFKSHLDGSIQRLTPQSAISIQEKLGADIIMAFDECAKPDDYLYSQKAMQRTHRWAEQCIKSIRREDQALFGIIQGGIFHDLRQQSAEFLIGLDFPGYAIGGLSVGESKKDMYEIVDFTTDILPASKPRYLMGVGTPEDLIEGVRRGIDMFDCVLPTRLARHQSAQTLNGRLNLMNAKYSNDESPIDNTCNCYTCTNFSKAYLRHLLASKEMLAATLLSIHNLHTLIDLMKQLQEAISKGSFDSFSKKILFEMKESKKASSRV